MAEAQNFDTNFVELDTSKMMMTSDSNYAICNHHFPSNWRSISVNGDEVTISTKDKQVIVKKYSALTAEERSSLESIKGTLTPIIRLGPFNVKSQTGFVKITTFDRNGGTSTMGTGGSSSSSTSGSSSSSSSSSSGGMSIQRTGPDAFIVCKPDFPFNWQRVFVIEDVATAIYKDGRVIMLPQDLWRPDERAKLQALRQEVDKATKVSSNFASSVSGSFKSPMEFVNKALGGIFG